MALPPPDLNTTVVVTGASSGIGTALARELAAHGHGLTLVARREERLDDLAAELQDEHEVKVDVHVADLAKDRARDRLVHEIGADGRRLVGLCNNAGVGVFGRVVDHEPAEEAQVVRLNLLALHDLTVRLLPGMVERGEGAILNTSSVLAFAPIPHNATYAATKAFITSFSEALHTELIGSGVSCTAVHPGPTRTEVFDRSGAPGAAGKGPGVLWQDPSEVARDAVRGMEKGSRSVVPGLSNQLIALGLRSTLRTPFLPLARLAQSDQVRRALGVDGEPDQGANGSS